MPSYRCIIPAKNDKTQTNLINTTFAATTAIINQLNNYIAL
jgi:hypothetical protein